MRKRRKENMNQEIETVDEESPLNAWEVNTTGKFAEHFFSHLKASGFSKRAIEDILYKNSVDILSQCPKPNRAQNNNNKKDVRTGIIIGKVQSGKTSNFIALTALAFDNDYDLVIVLGGNKNDLVDQNHSRIEKALGNLDNVKVLSIRDDREFMNPQDLQRLIENEKKVIITSIKITLRINQLKESLSNYFFKNRSVLIIDDEADQASFNNLVRKGEESATYKSILNLKNNFHQGAFIEVTATPYANMLIDEIDQLSPDFGALVDPGDEYCGFAKFHSLDKDCQNNKVVEITDEELLLDEKLGLPDSLEDALISYFLGIAVGNHRLEKKDKSDSNWSMLIHPSQLNKDQTIVKNKIKIIIDNDWKSKAEQIKNGGNDCSLRPFKKKLAKKYDDLKEQKNSFPEYNEIEQKVFDAILNTKIHLINSISGEPNENVFPNNIFIGGEKAGRGITFTNLIITYLSRRAKNGGNADTVEQRARWFGYKKDYLDLCRVYMPVKVARDFEDIYTLEEDLWLNVRNVIENDGKFSEISRIFKFPSEGMNPTRTSVADYSKGYLGEWTRAGYINYDINYAKKNCDLIDTYISSLHYPLEAYLENFAGSDNRKILRKVNCLDMFNGLFKKYKFPKNKSGLNLDFIVKLRQLFDGNNLLNERVNIVRIGSLKSPRLRSVDVETGKINQLFQGQQKHRSENYPGDSNLFAEGDRDRMQLQIHYIAPKANPELIEPVFALYLPFKVRQKLSKYVYRNESR